MKNRLVVMFLAAAVICTGLFGAAPVAAQHGQHPVYGCYRIITTKVDRLTVKVESDAHYANGAVLVERTYDFGDGTRTTTNDVGGAPVLHTYREAGIHMISVMFRFNVGGQEKTVTGSACQTTFTVETSPTASVYSCDSLTAQRTEEERTAEFRVTYTAQNGATLQSITYDFGDGWSRTLSPAIGTVVRHHYDDSGLYTATTTLYFSVTDGSYMHNKSVRCTLALAVS